MTRQQKSLQLDLVGTAKKPNDPAQQSPAPNQDISQLGTPTNEALSKGTKEVQGVLNAIDEISGTTNKIGDLADQAIKAAGAISNSTSGNTNSANQIPSQNTPNQSPPAAGGGNGNTGSTIGGGGQNNGNGNGGGNGTGATSPNDDMGDNRGHNRPTPPIPTVQLDNAQFTALVQAVNATADALNRGNDITNRELRGLRTQITTLSDAISQNGLSGVADESIETLNRAAHKLTTQIGKLGDSVDSGLRQLDARLGEFSKKISSTLADAVATELNSLKTTLESNGTVTNELLDKLLSKVDALGSATKLDQQQIAALTGALSGLEENKDTLQAGIKALQAGTQQLFRELIDEVKSLKGVGQKQGTAQEQQSELATRILEVKNLLNKPKELLKKWGENDFTEKENNSPEANLAKHLKDLETLKEQLNALQNLLLTSDQSKDRASIIAALRDMHKEMTDLHETLADVRRRSETKFGRYRDPQKNPPIQFPENKNDAVCDELHKLSEAMHKVVEASHSKYPDLVTLGVEEKLGTKRILDKLDNNPANFQSKEVLRELHCNGWIYLEKFTETSRGLEFEYKGQYQKNQSTVSVKNPSQLFWAGISWGTAALIPALSLGMGVATGSLGVGSAVLSCAGLPGKMLESTVRAILDSKFKLQLKQQALTLAYSPERMFAEAVGAAKMMQVLSKSVGVLDLWVIRIPFGKTVQGTESNDPLKSTVTPCITALRRVVTNWDKMSPNRDATAARSIRKEYEDALDSVVNSAQAASAAWTRFLNPPINVLNQECNLGLGGTVFSGLAFISKFIV